MEQLIDSIRVAVAQGASDEAKAAGATACRTILIALEAKPGEPMAAPAPISAHPQVPEIAAIVAGLKGVPIDQLLDLAITKLRTMVPAEPAAPVQKLAIPLVPVPRR